MKQFVRMLNSDLIQKSLLSFKKDLPRIIYYHLASNKITIKNYYKKNYFTEQDLKNQLNWLVRHGYKFITLDEAVYMVKNNEKATKTVAFTTDDGFKENYSVMASIFKKFNITSTLFLVSNFLTKTDLRFDEKINCIVKNISSSKNIEICNIIANKYNLKTTSKNLSEFSKEWPLTNNTQLANFAWELSRLLPIKLYIEKESSYMSVNQIKELLGEGYIVGSHSKSHPDFSKITENEALTEMTESKSALENLFNINLKYFAYPYGKRPSKTVENIIFEKNIYKLFFGTRNNLTNDLGKKIWERDRMEQSKEMNEFWFSAMPILRNLVLHPLGKYV